MVEFLEFINAPEQFYIARDLQLYFPLEELYKIIKKCHSEDEIEDLKIAVFTNILMQTSTDMGRFVRNIKTIVGTDYQEEFLDEQKLIAEKVVDSLPSQGQVNTSVIREVVRANDETVQELERSMDRMVDTSGYYSTAIKAFLMNDGIPETGATLRVLVLYQTGNTYEAELPSGILGCH